MSSSPQPSSGRERVRAYRDRLRRQGLRPIQIWVPDTRSPLFAEEAHRQALAVASSASGEDDQAFIESIEDLDLGEDDDETR